MSRIRANQITNQSADGAPTVQNGLVITGVTTSTTFSGSGASLTNLPSAQLTGALPALDGSNLTGLSGVSVANQADNRLITATGTTDALNGEANLTFDGNDLTITGVAPCVNLTDTDSDDYKISNTQGVLAIRDTTAGADRFVINDNGTGYFQSNFLVGGTTTSPGATFHVKNSYASVKIDSDGANNDVNLYFKIGASKKNIINFGDNDDADIGQIFYDHNGDYMSFKTNTNERLRIDSNGYVTTKSELWVGGSAPVLRWRDSTHGEKATARISGSDLYFEVANNERLRINSSGYITKPNQPMCSYDLNSSIQSGNYIIHNNVHTNNGSHYNTGNGRFVCPVAGYYYASIMAMTNNSSTQLDIELHKNGSNPNNILVPYNQSGGTYNQVAGSCIIYCAANDYLQFKLNSGSVYNGRHGNASFALLA